MCNVVLITRLALRPEPGNQRHAEAQTAVGDVDGLLLGIAESLLAKDTLVSSRFQRHHSPSVHGVYIIIIDSIDSQELFMD